MRDVDVIVLSASSLSTEQMYWLLLFGDETKAHLFLAYYESRRRICLCVLLFLNRDETIDCTDSFTWAVTIKNPTN